MLSRPATRATSGGFSLIELMVVVILIGILAVMAIPSMSDARMDQQGYRITGNIADLIREGRSHAIGRGAATTVSLSAKNKTFTMYEAIGLNQAGAATKHTAPRTTCGPPTDWTKTDPSIDITDFQTVNARQVQQIALAASETSNGFKVRVFTDTGTPTSVDQLHICFTPLGRTYLSTTATPSFDGISPMSGLAQVEVSRVVGGNTLGFVRRILVPPSGAARVINAPSNALLP